MRTNRSVAVATAALCLGFLFAGPGPAQAAPGPETGVTWFLDPSDSFEGLKFPCGHLGTFAFKKGFSPGVVAPKCAGVEAKACGSEVLHVYPSPPFPGKSPAASKPALAKGTTWRPCQDHSCFRSVDEISWGSPWVAVIDWDDLHGQSVGWTIQQLANPDGSNGIPVVLFDLYAGADPLLAPFSTLGATDVHVLQQLCRIAELADARGAPPSVINMSFGRRRLVGDPVSASGCDERHLSCQVAKVLHDLACGQTEGCPEIPRTVPIAAAGNQPTKPMFPAAHQEVLAAGALQLGEYGASGKVKPTWETPTYSKKIALLPSYGLCLEQGLGAEWPAPPGTSYAAAILSGWLADKTRQGPLEAPFSDAWFPRRQAGERADSSFTLAHGEKDYGSNPRVDQLFNRLLTSDQPCGGPATGHPGARKAVLGDPVSLRGLLAGTQGFIDVLDQLTGLLDSPAPLERPCVSCLSSESASPPSRAGRRSDKAATGRMSIDMAASARGNDLLEGFPDLESLPDIERETTYLRVGDTAFQIVLEGGDLPLAPDTQALAFETRFWIPPGEQPSLIYFYRSRELRFWTSVPILLR